MTVRYVGIGGSDANSGLTWALRKLTLNGAEDTPVAAGDTVYVGAGTYRELLTVDVSGTVGNPITYIGDYTGVNTDGVGGVVRVTGSADDAALTRANCITATSKDYRTFQGFVFDGCSAITITLLTACSNWIIDGCYIAAATNQRCISFAGTGTTNTVRNCFILAQIASGCIFTHTSTVDNAAHLVENCIVISGSPGVGFARVGGGTVKNCFFLAPGIGIQVTTALTGGQTETVNNCSFVNVSSALQATVTGEITENYNNFAAVLTARTNTATGANSTTNLSTLNPVWFFELVGGKGRMITPFDMASYNPLINLAGTSPTTTDMRGTAVIGAQREWGALEYDSTLLYRRVIARNE